MPVELIWMDTKLSKLQDTQIENLPVARCITQFAGCHTMDRDYDTLPSTCICECLKFSRYENRKQWDIAARIMDAPTPLIPSRIQVVAFALLPLPSKTHFQEPQFSERCSLVQHVLKIMLFLNHSISVWTVVLVEWLNYDFVHTGSLPEIGELMGWGSSTS